jgi:hypothetical protein
MNPQHWYPERSKKTDSEKALLTSYFVYLAMFWIRNNLDGTIRIQNSPIGRCGFATLIPPVSRFLIRKEKNDCYDHPNNFSSFSSFRFVLVRRTQRRPVFQEVGVGVVELGAGADVEETMRLCAYSHLVATPCRFVLMIL